MFQMIYDLLGEINQSLDIAYKIVEEVEKSSDIIIDSSTKILSSFDDIYSNSFDFHKNNNFSYVTKFFNTLSCELDYVKNNTFSNYSSFNLNEVDNILSGKTSWTWKNRLDDLENYVSDFNLSIFDKQNIFSKINTKSYLKKNKKDLYFGFVAKYL